MSVLEGPVYAPADDKRSERVALSIIEDQGARDRERHLADFVEPGVILHLNTGSDYEGYYPYSKYVRVINGFCPRAEYEAMRSAMPNGNFLKWLLFRELVDEETVKDVNIAEFDD